MLAALEAGDYETAATEALDSRWAQQVGHRAHNIAERIRLG
jgi:lysozyme